MPSLMTCNLVVALLVSVAGGAITYTCIGYGISLGMFGPGAGFWPFILGCGLLVFALFILVDTVKHQDEYAKRHIVLTAPGNLRAYQMMGIVTVYTVLVFVIGFYAATFLFLLAAMRFLGAPRLSVMLSFALAFLGLIFLIFSLLLRIPLPLPLFME